MAALAITEKFRAFIDFIGTGFKYNVQVLPDTVTAAALLFALLFQSPPLATLGGSFILLNFLHPSLAGFLSQVVSRTLGEPTDPSVCSGYFPGISYERLLSMSSERTFGALNSAAFPSWYSVFLGFFMAWIGALPLIYYKEIAASPKRAAASTSGLVAAALIVGLGISFRLLSGCDTWMGVAVGVGAGAFLGGMLVVALAWLSDRRLTNVLGFPLIRDRAADGKPIYVCERGGAAANRSPS